VSYSRYLAEYLGGDTVLGEGAGDIAAVGSMEATGFVVRSSGPEISAIGTSLAVGYVIASSGPSIIAVGRLEGDGYAISAPAYILVWPISSTHLHLEWPAGGGNIDFYEVQRERWLGASWGETTLFSYLFAEPEEVNPALSYEDTTVVTGELYRYRVQAVGQ